MSEYDAIKSSISKKWLPPTVTFIGPIQPKILNLLTFFCNQNSFRIKSQTVLKRNSIKSNLHPIQIYHKSVTSNSTFKMKSRFSADHPFSLNIIQNILLHYWIGLMFFSFNNYNVFRNSNNSPLKYTKKKLKTHRIYI